MNSHHRRLKALEAKEQVRLKDEAMTESAQEAWARALANIEVLVESDNLKTREVAQELVDWLEHHETTDTDFDLTTLSDGALDMLEQVQIEAAAP